MRQLKTAKFSRRADGCELLLQEQVQLWVRIREVVREKFGMPRA